jgi:hypothetical protein
MAGGLFNRLCFLSVFNSKEFLVKHIVELDEINGLMDSIVHKPHVRSRRYKSELLEDLDGIILKDLILIINEYGNNGEYYNNLMETVLSRFMHESMSDVVNNVIFTIPGTTDLATTYDKALEKFAHTFTNE